MSPRAKLLRAALYLTQLGLSVMAPPVLLTLFGVWLQGRFGLGNWVLAAAIVAGLISSFCAARAFYRMVTRDARKKDAPPPAWSRHE